jgi:hypothetical protein
MGGSLNRGVIRMNRVAICLSIAGIALAACGSKPDPATAQAQQAARMTPAPDDPLGRMARAVGNGAQSASFTEVEPQKPYVHTLTVQPDRTGVFYLSVVVTTQIGNQNLSRTFSVPFAVGNVPAQQKAAPQTDASGEPVQPAKALETTRPG